MRNATNSLLRTAELCIQMGGGQYIHNESRPHNCCEDGFPYICIYCTHNGVHTVKGGGQFEQ
jgi:hypothetical protein